MSFLRVRRRALMVATASAAVLFAFTAADVQAVNQYNGALGNPAVDPAFAGATATHVKQFIDFDNDGLVVAPGSWAPIPSNHYAAQGVTLLNLDVRNFTQLDWTHSPPLGAWHTGFGANITTPYSFVFTSPVASFGLFSNDLEDAITVTVHRNAGGNQVFSIPRPVNGGANITQFHGFASNFNEITRIDFMSFDYHMIDDIQFGFSPIPEPMAGGLLGLAALAWGGRRNRPR